MLLLISVRLNDVLYWELGLNTVLYSGIPNDIIAVSNGTVRISSWWLGWHAARTRLGWRAVQLNTYSLETFLQSNKQKTIRKSRSKATVDGQFYRMWTMY